MAREPATDELPLTCSARRGYAPGKGDPISSTQLSFRSDRLARLREIEPWHFWFAARRELLERLLRRHVSNQAGLILDVGCGTGTTLKTLSRLGGRVLGLDLLSEGLRAARSLLPDALLLQGDATRLPIRSGVVNAVTVLDVLEHVDDQDLLSEVYRVLRPGGLALLTVPGMPGLWSYRDEDAGHLRRYRREGLARLLEARGFDVKEIRHYQCLLLPLLMITRRLGRKGPRARNLEEKRIPLFNTAATWINRVETRIGDVIPLPFGSSLVAVCGKPSL